MLTSDLSQVVIACQQPKNHNSELDGSRNVYKINAMPGDEKYPFAEQGRRLRWLRQAEQIPSGSAFAAKVGWPQSGVSQFETGMRSVPASKALQLKRAIPGFDPVWLWEGDKERLGFDLRRRIEAEEAKEAKEAESAVEPSTGRSMGSKR